MDPSDKRPGALSTERFSACATGLLHLTAIFPAVTAERPGSPASRARICHEYGIRRRRIPWILNLNCTAAG
jgi:hypothetical protein